MEISKREVAMAIFNGNEYWVDGLRSVARVGAAWRDFDPNTGQYGAFARAPGPQAVRNAWAPPAPRPANPNSALQAPYPVLPPASPRPPAQPMSDKNRNWLAFGIFGAAAVLALAIFASSQTPAPAPATKPVVAAPAAVAPTLGAVFRDPDGPGFCRRNGYPTYHGSRYNPAGGNLQHDCRR